MTTRACRTELIVFAREPRAGSAKTRLIPALGPKGAADLYRAMLMQTLDTASGVEVGRHSLWLDVSAPGSSISRRAEQLGFVIRQQSGVSLGERMGNAFGNALREAESAILIGSDCPGYSAAYLQQALAELERRDAVLGPAADGGYVLIGIRQPGPKVFEQIDWGTERVLEQTRERMRGLGWRWSELATLQDIDEPQDLQHLPLTLKKLVKRH